jgi:hypothetical protein
MLAVRNTGLGAQRATAMGGSTEVIELDLADLWSVRACSPTASTPTSTS